MRILLYIILGLVLLTAGFFAWFFLFFLKVPPLEITADLSDTEKVERLDKWFNQLQETDKFNGVVLFAKEGKPLLAKGYGYTNHTKQEKLTKHSSLRLASVSKQFTAAGMMLLKEQGKVTYEDVVSKYIPDFPYEGITIRQLLNQTSGVPDIYIELAEKNKAKIPLLSNQIAVDLLCKEKRKRAAAPNEKYQYSNTDYMLLARIIEVVSAMTFEDFMKKELFEPLGMSNTRVWGLNSKDKTFKNKADDFENFRGKMTALKPSFIDGVAGDGAVFSSALDMLKWDGFWYENALLSQESLSEAFKTPILKDGSASDYGFGWVITQNGMWHNGAWLGARTIFIRNTDKKTSIAILDNSSNVFFDKIVGALKAAALQKS
jgi:CubicO group peptidase (beta-lactamase class C family)